MAERNVPVEVDGKIIIQAELLQLAGTIDLKAEPGCERAQLTISVDDEATAGVDVFDDPEIEWRDGRLSISVTGREGAQAGGPVTITGTVPPGSTLEAATTSAAIVTNGVAEVDARTDSGNVTVDKAEYLKARLKGGDLTVGEASSVDGRTTGSGTITIAHAGHIDARTEAGDISVDVSDGDTWVRSRSGGVHVRNFEYGEVLASTMTGPITVDATETSGGGAITADSERGAITVSTQAPETVKQLRVSAKSGGQVTVPDGTLREGPELPATSGDPLSKGTRASVRGAGRATDTTGPAR